MDDYQTALGRIQDAEVMLAALGRFVRRDKAFDPAPVREFYEQRHQEVIAAALAGINEVHSFWRAAPEGPFPWEQTP
jgi:hypothetical protein